MTLQPHYRGALLGLACGDAVGAALEFSKRGERVVTGMEAGGPFGLPAGYWTDDTAMALCLAESLFTQHGFDAADQMNRYLAWYQRGHLSSTGRCFDIGHTTRQALERYAGNGRPWAGPVGPNSAGNGSIMRLAPIVLFFFPDYARTLHYAAESSRTTHGAVECVEGCMLLAAVLYRCLVSDEKESALYDHDELARTLSPRLRAIARGDYRSKEASEIRGTGYVVESLEAALWTFATTDSFEAAVLAAANLGDDADTTAAVCGQVAGAFYSEAAIPPNWIDTLHKASLIGGYADALYLAAT